MDDDGYFHNLFAYFVEGLTGGLSTRNHHASLRAVEGDQNGTAGGS
jgi:hypothetical protein